MKKVKAYLKKNKPLEVKVTGDRGQVVPGLLLSDKLVLLNEKKDVLHLLSPIGTHNSTRTVLEGHVALLETLFKIDDTIEHAFEPDRFLTELTKKSGSTEEMFEIVIDGELVYKNISGRKADKQRNSYLRERKLGDIKFNHMRITSPDGLNTDYLFNQ